MDKTQETLTECNLDKRTIKRLNKKVKISKRIDQNRIPKHVAFIMDGNGRWAQRRGLPRKMGHKFGAQKIPDVVKRCTELNIKYVSLYAFSTENWNRPKEELDEMFRLARTSLQSYLPHLMKQGIRLRIMGDISRFPSDLKTIMRDITLETTHNRACNLTLCVGYGGRAEIANAANQIRGQITEDSIQKALYCPDIPDPDLIIRTSGEQRISNFMLWQMAYSELLFLKQHWPAMTPKLVDKCIIDFQKRKRRYGGISKDPK